MARGIFGMDGVPTSELSIYFLRLVVIGSRAKAETKINLDVAQIPFPGWAPLTGGEVQLWHHGAGSMKTLKT